MDVTPCLVLLWLTLLTDMIRNESRLLTHHYCISSMGQQEIRVGRPSFLRQHMVEILSISIPFTMDVGIVAP
jgi:hypothetical protein